MKSAAKTFSMAPCTALVLTPLAASADEPFDIQSQVGPNPVLPDIQQYLFPPMHLSSVVGWKNGEKPTVAPGLKIEALATDLQHPRSLYTLPNGDVLVVESKAPPPQPITRPKDIVMRFIEKMVTSGGDTGPSNRITLLRYDAAGGKPPTRSVFLDHLHSPFGVVLVGEELYVANTDAIVRYPYHDGDQTISANGVTLTPLPGGPIDHHWTKSLQPVETARCFMSASAPTATSPRTASRRKIIGLRSGKSIARADAGAFLRAASAIQMD
jgi:glucose/arabinose dehydrogenase